MFSLLASSLPDTLYAGAVHVYTAGVGQMIQGIGGWGQSNIAVPVIRLLGVGATIFGFWKLFKAITARQGQGGYQWLQCALGLVVGFAMIGGSAIYNNVGQSTADSVSNAVGSGNKAPGYASAGEPNAINLTGITQVGHGSGSHTVVFK